MLTRWPASVATSRTRWLPPPESATGNSSSDAELAALACALVDVQVRDTLYALAVGHNAGEAESLWALLSRSLPTPWRAEALVLLAFSAYARGDGPLAGVSLEAALRCEPGHRMAGMLDTALQSGLRPEHIRELAVTGYRLAERARRAPTSATGVRSTRSLMAPRAVPARIVAARCEEGGARPSRP